MGAPEIAGKHLPVGTTARKSIRRVIKGVYLRKLIPMERTRMFDLPGIALTSQSDCSIII